MAIYVYADESGVLDKNHEKYFVYAGLIFLDRETRDRARNKYRAAEKALRKSLTS